MNINDKKVDLFNSLIDKACMVYYNDLRLDYLEAFIRVSNDITKEFDETKLSKKAIEMLNKIYERIESEDFLDEEVRLACELVLIKGFKHRNVLLDFITPDFINYLFSHIIKSLIAYNKKYSDCESITILDTVLGTGNLLQTIMNNVDISIKGVGIEKDELLVQIAKSVSELLDNNVVINYDDALKDNNSYADIVIGDFGESKDIYKIMEKRLDNLDESGYFIYLINNDFFTNATNEFKDIITKEATLIGLIILPSSFTNATHVGKSILIGKKDVLTDFQMAIIKVDEDLSQEHLQATFDKINNMFKRIGG